MTVRQKPGTILFGATTRSTAADIEIELTSLVQRIASEISATSSISASNAAQLHNLRIRSQQMLSSLEPPLVDVDS